LLRALMVSTPLMVVTCTCLASTCIITAIRREPLTIPLQLCGFGIFNSFRHGPCNGSPPFPLSSPSIRLSHHCLDGWSAGTGCAAFHLSISSLLPAISSARTHDCFSQSFHLIKFIHLPSIYFRPATASTSNSSNPSDSSSCTVLGVLLSRVPCTPSLRVNNFVSRLPSIQPASSAPSGSAS